MPLTKLQFRPGVVRDTTNYANEGGWYECDKIRFFSGYPQKIGGWVEATSERVVGTCRQMWNWITSYTDNFLAVGTNAKVYIEVGGIYYDITPLRTTLTTPATDDCVETTNTSTTVNIAVTGHGCQTGDYVTISGVTGDVGGVPDAEINTEHIVTVIDADNFTITVTTAATSTTSGGGNSIDIACQITPGFPLRTAGYGWGTGAWMGSNIEPALGPSATDDCITTSSGSAVVTFTVTSHGLTTGDYITLSGVTGTVGGIADQYFNGGTSGSGIPNGNHQITSIDADNFTITVGVSATSNATGGGTNIYIERHVPETSNTYGWGLASSTPVFLPQRDWWFDNFDNDLVMNIRSETTGVGAATGGPIYYWERGGSVDPLSSLGTRAILLSDVSGASNVPAAAGQILISQNDKHLLAFGCTPFGGSDYDPLLIRWASQDDPQYWNVTTALAPSGLPSTAGFLRVSRGSRIVRAIPTRQEIVVLTDTHLYSLQFLGTADIFGLQELTDNISIISPRSVTTASNIVYWMGVDKFYRYDGRIQTLPCTLREYVFKDLNYAQADQIICGTNEGFNEIWWFYPSLTSDWVDRYVIYNHLDNIWYYGNLGRTAWLDTASRDVPTAIYTPFSQTGGGILYNHETGVNDANLPMEAYIQSSDQDIGDGEHFMLTRRMIPDINFNQSTIESPEVKLTVRSRDWPGSNFQNDPSDTQRVIESSVGLYTNQVFVRARGRQMALKVASDQLNVQWQLGDVRLDARPDGRR